MEKLGIEEVVDGDVAMGGDSESEDSAEGGVEVPLQVVHYCLIIHRRSEAEVDQQSVQLHRKVELR